jgi:hypothetical protein
MVDPRRLDNRLAKRTPVPLWRPTLAAMSCDRQRRRSTRSSPCTRTRTARTRTQHCITDLPGHYHTYHSSPTRGIIMIVSLIRLSAVLAVLGHVTAVPTRAADPRSFQNGDSDVQCYVSPPSSRQAHPPLNLQFTCPSLDGYTLDTSTATNSYYAGYQVSAQVCQ